MSERPTPLNGGVATCSICKEHNAYVLPLHGDKGGPLCCPLCIGQWHGEHGRRRRLGRIVIRAMAAYFEAGGKWSDTDKLKLSALGKNPFRAALGENFDPLGYLGETADTTGEQIELTSELLSDAIRLTHPDHHPPERQALAHRVTQELLKLQPFVFSAPKLNVAKAPPQTGPCYESTSGPAASAKEPSRPSYPCKDCADTIPLHYCDACSAEWDRRRQKEHDRETSSQRAWYARRRKRALAKRPAKHCASCGKQFDPKRADAQFCSARCRQRTHRGAAITDKSKPSAQPLFIRDAQRLILTALKHHPAVFLNDILPPERTNAQYQALFRASRLLEDAGEIGSKSYYFRFMKPGFLALVRPGFKPKHPDKIVRLTPDQRQAIAGEQP